MAILLTNDDGVHAPGLAALRRALAKTEEVVVVGPAAERSGASHALTMHDVLRALKTDHGWAVTGTPVDAVYVGVHHLLDVPPEIVLSGINLGANLGDDVHYSGTVGAAREAALMGLPSIAVSLYVDHERDRRPVGSPHFETAAHYAQRVLAHVRTNPLPTGTFVNLNVPDVPLDEVKGLRVCRLGRRHYEPIVEARVDPRNRPYYWIGGHPVEGQMESGTDGWWAAQGWATLSPIQLDCTAHDSLGPLMDLDAGVDIV